MRLTIFEQSTHPRDGRRCCYRAAFSSSSCSRIAGFDPRRSRSMTTKVGGCWKGGGGCPGCRVDSANDCTAKGEVKSGQVKKVEVSP